MKFRWVLVFACALSMPTTLATAAPDTTPATEQNASETSMEDIIYIKKRKLPMLALYKKVLLAFENNGYFVTSEPNISKSMAPFAQRWGNDYNRNKIEEIRSMVLSNPWFANKVANADPYLLAMFPLHVTLIQKGKFTTILFIRPSNIARTSRRGSVIAEELEKDVIRIFENIL